MAQKGRSNGGSKPQSGTKPKKRGGRVYTAYTLGGEKVVKVERANGRKITLLNPAQRGRKYAKELKHKSDVYTGEKLRNTQLSFRSGYLKARADNAKAYKHNQKKKGR